MVVWLGWVCLAVGCVLVAGSAAVSGMVLRATRSERRRARAESRLRQWAAREWGGEDW